MVVAGRSAATRRARSATARIASDAGRSSSRSSLRTPPVPTPPPVPPLVPLLARARTRSSRNVNRWRSNAPSETTATAPASRSQRCLVAAAATSRAPKPPNPLSERYGPRRGTSRAGGMARGANAARRCRNTAASARHAAEWWSSAAPRRANWRRGDTTLDDAAPNSPPSAKNDPSSPSGLAASTTAAHRAKVAPRGSSSGPTATTAALTSAAHAARSAALVAGEASPRASASGAFISANATRTACVARFGRNAEPAVSATDVSARRDQRCVGASQDVSRIEEAAAAETGSALRGPALFSSATRNASSSPASTSEAAATSRAATGRIASLAAKAPARRNRYAVAIAARWRPPSETSGGKTYVFNEDPSGETAASPGRSLSFSPAPLRAERDASVSTRAASAKVAGNEPIASARSRTAAATSAPRPPESDPHSIPRACASSRAAARHSAGP